MAARRYYYSDTITDFLSRNDSEIVYELTMASQHDINDETKLSWLEEIGSLKEVLPPYNGKGSVYFEYNIPRMGSRADVVLLIDGVVLVLEYKTAKRKFTHSAILQVWDYALDLKNFHDETHLMPVIPIVVAPSESNRRCEIDLKVPYEDGVFTPLCSNQAKLEECLSNIFADSEVKKWQHPIDDEVWARSGYNPTPTIIEAAVALYQHHNVEEISRHDADLDKTVQCVADVVKKCKGESRKAICFVTGVPGAGKTLIGLQTAITYDKEDETKAVYLSGNFPLVEVLQESLSRDYVRQETERYNREKEEIKKLNGDLKTVKKPITKKQARSEVKAFIQMVHHYRDEYMNGMKVKGTKLIKDEKYFAKTSEHAYVPVEHIAIFDEAQRAWTKHGLADFMLKKKKISNFPYSEPHYLISCMDRHEDWCVVICLVGGGQEIHHDEAGILEWLQVLNKYYKGWDIYLSEHLTEKEYAEGKALKIIKDKTRLHILQALHLTSSMRSFRGQKASLFVQHLLDLKPKQARQTLTQLDRYPIVLTRSMDTAKAWLKEHARGSERYGIMASSRAERLKAININVRYQPDFVHWFLDDDTDIRSSNSLEDVLTEFKVQGLEIDWACVVWDADLRLSDDGKSWIHCKLGSKTIQENGISVSKCRWNNIKKREIQLYQINAYRVLLTRARQGMVIVVPNGDDGVPPDETRKPEWYDGIYDYLKSVGIKEI